MGDPKDGLEKEQSAYGYVLERIDRNYDNINRVFKLFNELSKKVDKLEEKIMLQEAITGPNNRELFFASAKLFQAVFGDIKENNKDDHGLFDVKIDERDSEKDNDWVSVVLFEVDSPSSLNFCVRNHNLPALKGSMLFSDAKRLADTLKDVDENKNVVFLFSDKIDSQVDCIVDGKIIDKITIKRAE